MGIEKNTVHADEQISLKVKTVRNNGKKKVLFIGNSITRHEPKSDIGWFGDWGMAASCIDNDYVHVVLKFLEKKYGAVDYCIINIAEWESHYWQPEILSRFIDGKNFDADIVIFRAGENSWAAKDNFGKCDLEENYDKMVKFFTGEHAEKVILTSLFWRESSIDKALKAVAEKNGFDYVDIGDLGGKDECKALNEFKHAGVAMHPSDKGMKMIAERIIEKL